MDHEQVEQMKDLLEQLREAMLVQAATLIYVRMSQPVGNGKKILEAAFRQNPFKMSAQLVMSLRDEIRERLREQGE
jgi:hypothetical protein